MASILHIGMDVHTTNHTVCAYKIGADDVFAETGLLSSYFCDSIILFQCSHLDRRCSVSGSDRTLHTDEVLKQRGFYPKNEMFFFEHV